MRIDFKKAALAGVLGTVVFDIVGFALTGTFWDIPALLGSKLVGDGGLAVGVVGHYTIGVVLAIIYGGLAPSLPGNKYVRALTYISAQTVIGVWLFMMPLVGIGIAGLKAGALLPIISLVRHWSYALVLAAVYPVEIETSKQGDATRSESERSECVTGIAQEAV